MKEMEEIFVRRAQTVSGSNNFDQNCRKEGRRHLGEPNSDKHTDLRWANNQICLSVQGVWAACEN